MAYSTADYYQEHCPSLKHLWTKYLEHDDVMDGHHAGPQKQAKDYDPKEEPYFGFEVADWSINRYDNQSRILFECYRDKVHLIYGFEDKYREDHYMTHENCLKYLAQLPRGWYSFTTEGCKT